MAIDTLILGPFEFTDFAVPTNMPMGVDQQVAVHKNPGGARTIDTLGPDDHERTWSGILWGDNAASQMATLYALTRAGDPLPLNWGGEARTCVITKFDPKVERWTCIPYSITVTLDDDGDEGVGFAATLGDLIGGDLSAAAGLLL